ncbi:hypothetical protein F5Y19DRAFT_475317 [Xylariaceae sp. FL1651]|nr:hypothetical protein F5Y19DRAFT_475317 [Xylariaceae sp. FL1651]
MVFEDALVCHSRPRFVEVSVTSDSSSNGRSAQLSSVTAQNKPVTTNPPSSPPSPASKRKGIFEKFDDPLRTMMEPIVTAMWERLGSLVFISRTTSPDILRELLEARYECGLGEEGGRGTKQQVKFPHRWKSSTPMHVNVQCNASCKRFFCFSRNGVCDVMGGWVDTVRDKWALPKAPGPTDNPSFAGDMLDMARTGGLSNPTGKCGGKRVVAGAGNPDFEIAWHLWIGLN